MSMTILRMEVYLTPNFVEIQPRNVARFREQRTDRQIQLYMLDRKVNQSVVNAIIYW